MKVHPSAELFPLIEGREFEELVEDIRANGLRAPILLDAEGRVLDVRNRPRACQAAGVEPRFETWDGRGSPAEVVVSLNLRRRHLNESQRAMLAAKLKETQVLEATSANLRTHPTDAQAAEMFNVSTRSVEHARKLLRRGEKKLIQAVESGELAVSTAAGVRKRRSATRSLPVADGVLALWARPERLTEALDLIRRRFAEGSSETLLIAARKPPTS